MMKFNLIFLSCLAICGLSACATTPARSVQTTPALTKAIYQQLKEGMSYGEAVVILGKDGTIVSSISERGVKSILYSWQGDGFKQITALFRDGKLATKYEVELQ